MQIQIQLCHKMEFLVTNQTNAENGDIEFPVWQTMTRFTKSLQNSEIIFWNTLPKQMKLLMVMSHKLLQNSEIIFWGCETYKKAKSST